MILYPFLILLLTGVIYIVGLMLLRNSQDLIVLWGQSHTLELSTFTLAVGLLLLFILGYILIATLVALFMAPRRISQNRENKRHANAQLDLKNGLVNLVEGHWKESEELLIKDVAYSETPLLNYLGAARSAHMSQNYQLRDEYLKTASAYGDEAEIAVAVSQASMQFESGQVEQARATLTHLRELAPSHPYPNELLAPHTHEHEAQLVYVITGELEFEVGGKDGLRFKAPAGSYVIKPVGIEHAFWNKGAIPARYIELSGKEHFEN